MSEVLVNNVDNEVDISTVPGTLAQKAELLKGRKKKAAEVTKTMQYAQYHKLTLRQFIGNHTVPITDVVADTDKFSRLIDDRVVQLRDLVPFIEQTRNTLRFIINNPPQSMNPSSSDNEETSFEMVPSSTFWRSFARYANTYSGVDRCTGTFMDTASIKYPTQIRDLVGAMLLTMNTQLMTSKGAKKVMVRTLRKDPEEKWNKHRTLRAILHSNYRDDIGHNWIAKLMAEIVPTGRVARYFFDGDLLMGYVIIDDALRADVSPDDEYTGGIMFFSGEVGNRRVGCVPFLLSPKRCAMTLVGDIWGVTHSTPIKAGQLKTAMTNAVHSQIPLITVGFQQIMKAKSIFVPEMTRPIERLILAISKHFTGLTVQDLRLWLSGCNVEEKCFPEDQLSIYTLQAGLTRAAQGADVIKRMLLENISYTMLSLNWQGIFGQASAITDKKLNDMFLEE